MFQILETLDTCFFRTLAYILNVINFWTYIYIYINQFFGVNMPLFVHALFLISFKMSLNFNMSTDMFRKG